MTSVDVIGKLWMGGTAAYHYNVKDNEKMPEIGKSYVDFDCILDTRIIGSTPCPHCGRAEFFVEKDWENEDSDKIWFDCTGED